MKHKLEGKFQLKVGYSIDCYCQEKGGEGREGEGLLTVTWFTFVPDVSW